MTALGAAAAFLLTAFIIGNLVVPRPDPGLEAIRKQGYPVTLAELDAWYPQVPAAENAALDYTQAFALPVFSESNYVAKTIGDRTWLPPRGQALGGEAKTELAEVLATNQTALRLLHSPRPSSGCRYPVDLKQGWATPFSHLPGVKAAVNLLGAEALLHAANGQTEQAVQALLAAGRVADSLEREPMLLSQLVRISSWATIVSRLERVMNVTSLTDEQLASLQPMLARAERPEALARALAGERANGLAVFTDGKAQAAFLSGWDPGSTPQPETLRTTAVISLLKMTGVFRKDRAFYLQMLATNIAVAERPFPERVSLGQQASAGLLPGKFHIISSMLFPSYPRAFLRDADHAAHIRVTQTVLAVERFRRAHGNALPSDLEQLVPAYLSAVPTDPYDGKPLRFKKLGPGYVLYSIGRDLRDDGGLELDPKNPNAAHDVTFTVERWPPWRAHSGLIGPAGGRSADF